MSHLRDLPLLEFLFCVTCLSFNLPCSLHDALSGHSSSSVAEAVRYSEESRTKCIGLTIETRPDYCLTPHLTDMLSYGCTRLEMGVQVRVYCFLCCYL